MYEFHAAQGDAGFVDRIGNRATVSDKLARERENEKVVQIE